MIATGDETFLYSTVTVKLYFKPASHLIITVSINMAVRLLTHSTTVPDKVWLFYSVAGKVILANSRGHA